LFIFAEFFKKDIAELPEGIVYIYKCSFTQHGALLVHRTKPHYSFFFAQPIGKVNMPAKDNRWQSKEPIGTKGKNNMIKMTNIIESTTAETKTDESI